MSSKIPLVLGLAALIAPAAQAEPFFRKNTQISLGVFFTDQDTETRFNSNIGDGTDISFEDDLGLDPDLSVFRFDGYHRFANRHTLSLSIFDLSRDAVVTLEGEIEWQDTIFPVSADLATNLDFTVYNLAYTYEFLQNEKGYLGATLGLYTMDVGIGLELVDDELTAETSDLTAPLPLLGLRGAYALNDRWSVLANAGLFFAEFDNIEGTLRDILVGIEYQLSDRFAVSVAYNDVELDVEAGRRSLQADLVWGYGGAVLSFKFGF
ncbi:MAG: hypothetical protein AAFN78_15260 [Pseudomonadota bacterium]